MMVLLLVFILMVVFVLFMVFLMFKSFWVDIEGYMFSNFVLGSISWLILMYFN